MSFSPLLKYLLKKYRFVDLKNTYIIGAQHILPSTKSLIDACLTLGMKRSHISLIGKCYSTDSKTFLQLKRKKIDVSPYSFHFDSHQSYSNQYTLYIERFFRENWDFIKKFRPEKLLVLDDGGFLIERIMKELPFPCQIVGIEQTSSGLKKLSSFSLPFPLIEVASSFLKKEVESNFVAKYAAISLKRHVKALQAHPKNCLILGHGAIGKAVKRHLEKSFSVTVFDKKNPRTLLSREQLFPHLKEADLVVGCTGDYSLQKKEQSFLKKGAILASLSSGDIEFNGVDFRKNLPRSTICHQTIQSKGLYLISSGFPCNFTPDIKTVDPPEFGLTRALLFLGILVAASLEGTEKRVALPIDEEIRLLKLLKKLD